MKKNFVINIVISISIISNFVYSAFYYGQEFADILGVGGCGTVVLGSQAIFFNPAGLTGVSKNPEAFFSYNKHLITEGVDIDIYHTGFVYPIKFAIVTQKKEKNKYKKYLLPVKFTVGIGIFGIDVEDGLYKENVYVLAIATKMRKLLTGINFKILGLSYGKNEYTEIDPVFEKTYSKYSYTADIGFIYEFERIGFGLSLMNIIPADVALANKTEIVKLATNFAVKYKILKTVDVLTEVKLRDKFEDISFGFKQKLLNDNLNLAAGINTAQINFSFSYRIFLQNFVIEPIYTISYPYNISTYGTHNLTIKIRW